LKNENLEQKQVATIFGGFKGSSEIKSIEESLRLVELPLSYEACSLLIKKNQIFK
jgi:hypothetical protein